MSTAEVPPTDPGQGAAPAPEPAPQATEPAPDVQPQSGAEAQPDGGQGLLAPYLEGVDENVRPQVEQVLEKYRQDSDAQVTKKFEQLNAYKAYADDPSQLETPLSIYDNLVSAPADTIKWIVDRYREEAGLDLSSQLAEKLGLQPGAAPTATEPETEPTEEKPLTRADLEAWQQEQKQAEAQRQKQETQRQTIDTWISEAATQHGLEVGDDTVMKEAIIKAASQLLPQYKHLGQEAGKQSILSATEAFKNKFGARTSTEPATTPEPEPSVAKGGTPPAPSEPSLDSSADRKAFMRDWLTRQQQE